MSTRYEIIELQTDNLDVKEVKRIVRKKTGSSDLMFCPSHAEGEPFNGHVHVFIPMAVIEPDLSPIVLGELAK